MKDWPGGLGDKVEKKEITWQYIAGYFDASGSIREDKSGRGPRLRFNSYSRYLLEEIRSLADCGTIAKKRKPRGDYFRLDITGPVYVQRVLGEISPYLRVKTVLGDDWLSSHEFAVRLYQVKRKLRSLESRRRRRRWH